MRELLSLRGRRRSVLRRLVDNGVGALLMRGDGKSFEEQFERVML